MLIRSRIVYPVGSPSIENGGLIVRNGEIAAVGPYPSLIHGYSGPVVDLGDQILLPGLVNAHCHLDYTNFARHIPPPSGFSNWIKQLITLKAGWGYTDYAESWLSGLNQSIDHGTTTLGNIEAIPELTPDLLDAVRIRLTSFRELITVRHRQTVSEIIQQAEADLISLQRPLHRVGLSPHAPYSTTQELVRAAVATGERHRWPWTMHVSESVEESDMFERCEGQMYQWLKGQRDTSDCGLGTPIQWLAAAGGLVPSLLIAHANCITPRDIALMAEGGVSVVHCPRSHDYFGHPPFPYAALKAAGVRICLGTDSLASIRCTRKIPPTLSLFEEMRQFSTVFPDVSPEEIIQNATVHGAAALGLGGGLGQFSPGAPADWISIPLQPGTHSIPEAITHHRGLVTSSMVNGHWLIAPAVI